MVRRFLLFFVGASAIVLVPWTGYLARILPDRHGTDQWRLAWVGFDIALVCCFALAAWLGRRRHRSTVPLLAATAALLCCDAWFDVALDWAAPDRWLSLGLAVFVELPIAGLLVLRARVLLSGGMPSRRLTVRDIELQGDPDTRRLMDTLGELAPVGPEGLADALGRARADVTAALTELGDLGHARRQRDGRWKLPDHQDLRLPRLAELSPVDRPRVAAFIEAKYQREVGLLAWAAGHHEEFGPWGQGERARTHLTEAELARLSAEYNELVTRYCLLRTGPAAGTRDVAIRFYAFPHPVLDEVL